MLPNFTVNGYSNQSLNCVLGGHKPANMHQWGPGVRDVYALHYIVRGKGVFVSQHNSYALNAGESFMIFPETEVFYYPDELEPWEYVWIEFTGSEALRLVELTQFRLDKPVVKAAPTRMDSLFDISWAHEGKLWHEMRSEAQLRLLLSYYVQYYPRELATARINYANRAKQFIEYNYWKSSLSVADIVAVVSVDRSYLFRLFKEATGLSISSYLIAYRLQRASELLRSTDLSIKSIAYSIGYHDPLYFSKVFKKATSYTPSAYRMLPNTKPMEWLPKQ